MSGQLTYQRLAPATQQLVQAWPESASSVAEILGVSLDVGSVTPSDGGRICCTGIARWLLLSDNADWCQDKLSRLDPETASVTGLDHSRVGYRLSGPEAQDILMKGLAVDLDPSVTPQDHVISTVIHEIGVTIIVVGPAVFDIFVYASFAQSFSHWLEDAGMEYGLISI